MQCRWHRLCTHTALASRGQGRGEPCTGDDAVQPSSMPRAASRFPLSTLSQTMLYNHRRRKHTPLSTCPPAPQTPRLASPWAPAAFLSFRTSGMPNMGSPPPAAGPAWLCKCTPSRATGIHALSSLSATQVPPSAHLKPVKPLGTHSKPASAPLIIPLFSYLSHHTSLLIPLFSYLSSHTSLIRLSSINSSAYQRYESERLRAYERSGAH